eukprot:1491636-Heterocapsa_arctica.AAC.1
MAGASRNIGSSIPALEFGQTGALGSTGPGPTPFVRTIEAAPGASGGTGAVPSIRSFGSAVGASDSTVPTPS